MRRTLSLLLLLWLLPGCRQPASPQLAVARPDPGPPPTPYLLHLPGVSGESVVDHTLLAGFKEGHLDAAAEIYDWTNHDPGIPALQAYDRNQGEAARIAHRLTARYRTDPRITIYLTSHSGGAGLAVWTLEKLPDDVTIDTLLLLAPALSPQYDLTKALRHVRHAYAFNSAYDTLVLSVGTKMFGTIDGEFSDAAGLNGFARPAAGIPEAYAKLRQFGYDPDWARYGHAGDHIGVTTTEFSQAVLTPLLQGRVPAGATTVPAVPATRPAALKGRP